MAKVLTGISWAAIALGLFIMLLPFISTSRFAGDSLAALPQLDNVTTVDDNNGALTILDTDDFVLSTRTYLSTDLADVEEALLDSGFEVFRGDTSRSNGFFLPLDNEWDGLVVYLETDGEDAIAIATAMDTDIAAVWPILVFFGGSIVFVGVMMLVVRRKASPVMEVSAEELVL